MLGTVGELFKRSHVVRHGAIRRRHDRCRPSHHMVAGKQQIGSSQGKGHVVRRMARRRQCLDAPARTGDHFAVFQRDIRNEIAVGAGLPALGVPDMQRTRRAMRALGVSLGAGDFLDRGSGGGMIAMGMGDKDMRYRLALHRVEQRIDMHLIVRTGIEDGDVAASDDVTDGSFEGERSRIIGEQPAHPGRDLLDLAGREIEAFVEADIVHRRSRLPAKARRQQPSLSKMTPAKAGPEHV